MDHLCSVTDQKLTHRETWGKISPPSSSWPDLHFACVPTPTTARSAAKEVRRTACEVREAVRLAALLVAGGFRLDVRDLGVARGGPQALLQPAYDHGFRICADPKPRAARATFSMNESTRVHRLRFLAAHEIGHSFFYDRAYSVPRRLFPVGDSAEEHFCSEFARALLVPPEVVISSDPIASSIFSLASRFEVSTEVAARAFAALHPSRPLIALGYNTRKGGCPLLQWTGGTAKPGVSPSAALAGVVDGLDSGVAMTRAAGPEGLQVAVVAVAA